MALLRDGIELVVASVGDSRAMMCRKGKALKLTVDHTPERKDEKERYQDVVMLQASLTMCTCAKCLNQIQKIEGLENLNPQFILALHQIS